MTEDAGRRPMWRRSSFCADNACVELAAAYGYVYIRDAKEPDAAVLRFTRAEWLAFLRGAKRGEFDSLG